MFENIDGEVKEVTVLGKTFASEEERRDYFRDELRNKLPELRKMEGFPIGEDEDIINLSDPPYYTACPNPWLNEFIDEWEDKKKELEKQGERDADFKLIEPYAANVSVGKSNPVYRAHTYHTKVPHPAIMRYLLYYTQPGDIVLDAFGGTGMTGVAGQICKNPNDKLKNKINTEWKDHFNKIPTWGERKVISGDLSPYASFISYNYNTPTKLETAKKEADAILEKVTKKCSWLYETNHTNGGSGLINYTVWSDVFICHNCSGEIVFWDEAMSFDRKKIIDDFKCPTCQSINNKKKSNLAYVTIYDNVLSDTIKLNKSVPVYIVLNFRQLKK